MDIIGGDAPTVGIDKPIFATLTKQDAARLLRHRQRLAETNGSRPHVAAWASACLAGRGIAEQRIAEAWQAGCDGGS